MLCDPDSDQREEKRRRRGASGGDAKVGAELQEEMRRLARICRRKCGDRRGAGAYKSGGAQHTTHNSMFVLRLLPASELFADSEADLCALITKRLNIEQRPVVFGRTYSACDADRKQATLKEVDGACRQLMRGAECFVRNMTFSASKQLAVQVKAQLGDDEGDSTASDSDEDNYGEDYGDREGDRRDNITRYLVNWSRILFFGDALKDLRLDPGTEAARLHLKRSYDGPESTEAVRALVKAATEATQAALNTATTKLIEYAQSIVDDPL